MSWDAPREFNPKASERALNLERLPGGRCRCSECKYMKLDLLEEVRDGMKKLAPRIELPERIWKRARLPIERMQEISARSA